MQNNQLFRALFTQATYPMRVRHLLMELNRAVCLDHPEANIPWFHEKYCEEFLETGESGCVTFLRTRFSFESGIASLFSVACQFS